MEKKNYTITEAMPFFGVGRTLITHWINTRIIDAEKVKGKWVIDGQSMEEWKEFQGAGFKGASKEMQRRFEVALEKNRELMKF